MPRKETPGRGLPLVSFALLLLLLSFAAGCDFPPRPATASPPPQGTLVVNFVDIGQGDGILVQSGGENYVIDGGKPQAGPEMVDFLRSRGVKTVDGMVVSNPDADHIGGLIDVVDAFPVESFYLSGDDKGTATFNALLQSIGREVRQDGARTIEARTGQVYDWGGTRADVIAPPSDAEGGFLSEETNDNSVGILLTFGEARVLLAGDAEEKEEEYMASGPYAGPLTVLKVNHHGSNTSTTPALLNAFPPEIAVIQVGEDNSYGHPTPQTLDRLNRVGAKVFRNDEHGDVVVTIADGEVEVAVTEGG